MSDETVVQLRPPKPPQSAPVSVSKRRCRFHSYHVVFIPKTARTSLVLEWVDVETGEMLPDFYRVDDTYQRGPKLGQRKLDGGFTVAPRSKLGRLWLAAMGKPPRKWPEIARELHKLKAIEFTAEVKVSVRVNETTAYKQLINVKPSNGK